MNKEKTAELAHCRLLGHAIISDSKYFRSKHVCITCSKIDARIYRTEKGKERLRKCAEAIGKFGVSAKTAAEHFTEMNRAFTKVMKIGNKKKDNE